MKATVIRPDPATEFYTAERCHILELSNTANDEAMSIARARVEPGVATAFHKVIGTAERYLILSGEGVVEVAGQAPTKVDRGDVVLIPPGAEQRITNTGATDLVFLALCTPRFRPENYVSNET
ncbi:MAG: cupin domain-containing protein [Woeseiaceae bacterium]|nr:cupin domain-containing protein [Woeseiaceae bacterium]NIP20473.1 cupin domain-containing protein [Woeseiaceae bacterium]NIS89068.1 cupin domain-containing protein [Woeseiaceae bacterium]